MWNNLTTSMQGAQGGFMNDSGTAASLSNDTNDRKRTQNVFPVMIKHLVDCTDELVFWGMKIHMITFIAIIRQIEEATTKITYELEDDTGTVKAFRWLDTDKNTTDSMFEVNTYVRVFGLLREQQEIKHVLIIKMLPVKELNELTNHLLEVTYAFLKAEQMAGSVEKSSVSLNVNDISMLDNHCRGMTNDQAVIFKIIQADNDTEFGIERNKLKKSVPQNVLSPVDDIIDFLISEGHIYTTCTDDHFKTT